MPYVVYGQYQSHLVVHVILIFDLSSQFLFLTCYSLGLYYTMLQLNSHRYFCVLQLSSNIIILNNYILILFHHNHML